MFKLTRRTLAVVTAVAAMAVGIGAQAATPPVAHAANACAQWKLPAEFSIMHGNGWKAWTARHSTWGFTRNLYAAPPGSWIASMYGTMKFSRFDVSGINAQVRFTVSWTNGSAGVYTGTIDSDGFLTGTARDRFNGATTRFYFLETMDCA